MASIIGIILIALFLRLLTLYYSIKNEKRLRNAGAVEYGKLNSTVMAVLHTSIYLGSLLYAVLKKPHFDFITVVGIGEWVFSYAVLLIVIYQLRDVWTVKLLIAKGHKLNTGFIFKYIRHPNYFLNIIPELVAITIICKSWPVFVVLFPFYLVTLVVRIIEEEKVMNEKFSRP